MPTFESYVNSAVFGDSDAFGFNRFVADFTFNFNVYHVVSLLYLYNALRVSEDSVLLHGELATAFASENPFHTSNNKN